MRTLIAFHSDYGSTAAVAQAIAAGVRAACPIATVTLKPAVETTNDDLLAADLILFGAPVHMGSMAWQMKKLVDQSGKLWMENGLDGKVGGVFATGGGFGGGGGGAELTLISLYANFIEHGMIVVGYPKSALGYADGGIHWGFYARTGDRQGIPQGVSEAQLVSARSFGAHLAEVASKLVG